jgi:hypothetical protein
MAGVMTVLLSCDWCPAAGQPAGEVQVACYYFPNYHVDRRNENRHGPGWTEWELLKRAEPRFDGHRQPRVPAWGYGDEADPAVMARKIDAAADHGVNAFLFDWYHYDDGPFLQRGLDEGFLKAPNNARLKFALMWANHDWLDLHPAKLGWAPLQYPGRIKPETWERMTDHILKDYMHHPSYWRIQGRPYFSVYELFRLIESFGGTDATARALQHFRDKAIASGLPGLHLNAVTWGIQLLPGEQAVKSPADLATRLGLDSVTSYVWIHHVPLDEFPQTPYDRVMKRYEDYRDKAAREFACPYYPNVTMGWDSSPRTVPSDRFVNRGYPYMATMSGNTPAAFREALVRARDYLLARPGAERILTINAWNEWTEGSYLEPDRDQGMAYLQAIRDVFMPRPR